MGRFHGLAGLLVLLLLAYLLSAHRQKVSWRVVLAGVGLQIVLAALFFTFPPARLLFDGLAAGFNTLISFTDAGARFIFGSLADPGGPWGFIFATRVLPVVVFFAALMSVLYHLGVMQRIVAGMAWLLQRTLGISGTEALSGAANIFIGQSEAPLAIRPYLARMTRSQLMAVMTCGFATIAGSVMAAYVSMLGGDDPARRIEFAKHLMMASLLSAPAGLAVAKILLPETETPADERRLPPSTVTPTHSVLEAAAAGASEGLKLALNIAAVLMAFAALLAMLNWPLAALSDLPAVAEWRAQAGLPPFSLDLLLGWLFRPAAWLMGITGADAALVGGVIGKQVVATEFFAFMELAGMVERETISPRSARIAAYALCGFANLLSIGIQIGGLSALAPERRADFAALGLRAMFAGLLACWMTACIASVFVAE